MMMIISSSLPPLPPFLSSVFTQASFSRPSPSLVPPSSQKVMLRVEEWWTLIALSVSIMASPSQTLSFGPLSLTHSITHSLTLTHSQSLTHTLSLLTLLHAFRSSLPSF